MINLILQILIDKFMLSVEKWFLWIFKNSNFDQEVFEPIGTLDLIKIEFTL